MLFFRIFLVLATFAPFLITCLPPAGRGNNKDKQVNNFHFDFYFREPRTKNSPSVNRGDEAKEPPRKNSGEQPRTPQTEVRDADTVYDGRDESDARPATPNQEGKEDNDDFNTGGQAPLIDFHQGETDPLVLAKAYKRGEEYVQLLQGDMCPFCIAAVPVFDMETSKSQESRLKEALRERATRNQGYRFFSLFRDSLQQTKRRYYPSGAQAMIADTKPICTLLVRDEIIDRSKTQHYNSNQEVKRYQEKGENSEIAFARSKGYEDILGRFERGDDLVSCEDDYETEEAAGELQAIVGKILGS